MILETYRGFELRADRQQALGGWDSCYFSAERLSDGWFLEDDFTTGNDSEESIIQILKSHVDDFYEYPEDYEDED